MAQVYAQGKTALAYGCGVYIAADGRHKTDLQPQQPQVVGDVPPHPSGAQGDGAGVGVLGHKDSRRPAPYVHVDAAENHGGTNTVGLRPYFIFHISFAYSAIARSAANTPLWAVFTMDRRALSPSSFIRSYIRFWQSA